MRIVTIMLNGICVCTFGFVLFDSQEEELFGFDKAQIFLIGTK